MRSGLLWAGNSVIREQVFETLLEALAPVAASLVLHDRQAPDGEPSELEWLEIYALTEELMNAILPGCEGLVIGGDGTEQGELFADEDKA